MWEAYGSLDLHKFDLKPYKNTNFDQKINSLWLTSLLRIFYINDSARGFGDDDYSGNIIYPLILKSIKFIYPTWLN